MHRRRLIHSTKILTPLYSPTGREKGEMEFMKATLAGVICNHQGPDKPTDPAFPMRYCDLHTGHEGQHSKKYWDRRRRKNCREFWKDAPAAS